MDKSRKKFKIMYPQDHPDVAKQGKPYLVPAKHMIVMNTSGVFFQFCGEDYMQCISRLSDIIGNYDVVWK